MTKATQLRNSGGHQANLEMVLIDLSAAQNLLNQMISDSGIDEAVTVATLIERAGEKFAYAIFEHTLCAAAILAPGNDEEVEP